MNRWVRVLFLRLLVLPTVCALVVGIGLRYWFGIQDPQVTIPSPTQPNPGFDLLKAAGESVRADHKAIEQLLDAKEPPHPKSRQRRDVDKKRGPIRVRPGYISASHQAQVAELLRRHANTLALTRGVLHREVWHHRECRMPSLRSFADLCPYYGDFRTLAKLMILEGQYVRANGGTADDAARKYLDVIRLGEKVSHGGPLIGRLVSIAITTIGQNALAPLATEVSPAMARRVIQTIQQCEQKRAPFAEALTEEKYGMQAGILELYRNPERCIASLAEDEIATEQIQRIRMLPLAYLIWGKRTMFDNVTRQMDRIIEQAKQPYRADAAPIEAADDPISQYVFPVFTQARFKDVLVQTQSQLLIAQFATEAYRTEKRGEPWNPGQLTKAGYPTPIDPFADGKPLRYYAFLGTGANGVCSTYYRWYSVGPDRKDDGRKPCENPTASGGEKQKYQVSPSSTGDIVPGVNVFR